MMICKKSPSKLRWVRRKISKKLKMTKTKSILNRIKLKISRPLRRRNLVMIMIPIKMTKSNRTKVLLINTRRTIQLKLLRLLRVQCRTIKGSKVENQVLRRR